MLVKRIIDDWHVRFLTFRGIVDYHEYDLGMFASGEWVIYKDNMPRYLLALYYESEDMRKLKELYLRSSYFKDIEQLVVFLGAIRGEKLTSDPKRPIALPIRGFFTDSKIKEVLLELLLIDFELVKANLQNR